MDESRNGHVYVLSNPAMKGIVKIGRTCKSGRSRAKELYSQAGTALPMPFKMEFEMWCGDCFAVEQRVHEELDFFRINKSREFFRIDIDNAIKAVIRVVCYDFNLHVGWSDSVVDEDQLLSAYGEQTKSLIDEILPYGTQAMNLASALAYHLDIESVVQAIHRYKKACDKRHELMKQGLSPYQDEKAL